jgi:hypothetical protein
MDCINRSSARPPRRIRRRRTEQRRIETYRLSEVGEADVDVESVYESLDENV